MDKNPTVVFVNTNEVRIEERPLPTPGPGEVLIRTRRTLISTGTELTILSGEFPPDSIWAKLARFPFLPGYDNVGEVVALGPGVERFKVGQRVASGGKHAQFVKVPETSAYPIQRAEVSDEDAAFFTIAVIVVNGVRRANVRLGEAVGVYGLGLLGQLAVRYCHLCGARPVLGLDVAESRLKLLPRTPGVLGVLSGREGTRKAVEDATRKRMVDVVFEVTGNARLIPEEFKILREQGRFVVLSSPRGKTEFDFHDLCNSPSFTIIGAHNGSHPAHETRDNPWVKARHAELFFDLVADGDLKLAPLVSHREPFSAAERLYAMLLKDRSNAMGVILEWPG